MTIDTVADACDLDDRIALFVRSLRQAHASPNTIGAYETALHQLADFLTAHGHPTDLRRIASQSIDEWTADLLERYSPTTAHTRFRAVQRFFSWSAEADSSFASPMQGRRPPRRPEYQRALERDQQLDLLRACQGESFEDRRDLALIRILFDTGARRAEVAGLRSWSTASTDGDLNLTERTVRLAAGGPRERLVHLDEDTIAALQQYLSARREQPHASQPCLWLGRSGCLDDSGVGRALRDRGQKAGLPGLHRLGHGLWVSAVS